MSQARIERVRSALPSAYEAGTRSAYTNPLPSGGRGFRTRFPTQVPVGRPTSPRAKRVYELEVRLGENY